MNKADKISKAGRIIADSAKDNVSKNILNYVRTNKVALDEKQLASLLNVVQISVDESYQLALRSFSKSVSNILAE